MTTFNETDHRRDTVGRFAEKTNSAPEAMLASIDDVPLAPIGDAPVGYTYRAENLRPEQLVETLIREQRLAPGARGMTAEEALDQLAGAEGVDREDLYSFDSDDFPKPVYRDQVTPDDADWLGDDEADFDSAKDRGREDARNGRAPNPLETDERLADAYLAAYDDEMRALEGDR